MRFPRRGALLAAAALAFGGCATVKPTGYLDGYDRLTPGNDVEGFWSDPAAIARGGYDGIELGTVEVRSTTTRAAANDEAKQWLTAALLDAPAGAATAQVCGTASQRPARLDVAITEMTPGSGFWRVLAGELGAGHAWVQVEGRVVDPASGAQLAAFADRQRDSGATGLRDSLGDVGPTLVRERLTEIGESARKELARAFRCSTEEKREPHGHRGPGPQCRRLPEADYSVATTDSPP